MKKVMLVLVVGLLLSACSSARIDSTANMCYKTITTCAGAPINYGADGCMGIRNPYAAAVVLNYTMAGGGGGGTPTGQGGGGGSTALFTNDSIADIRIARGGNIASDAQTVTGTLTFNAGTTLYAFVGGGGGYDWSAGGAGWFGGNSGHRGGGRRL
ncbi:MAG: hypothetical protein FWF23_01200 [Alphaproteobacteria bacterium]|nr:hypothetical protein [Alphaproteobacteria bacterium]MCL2505256.1 hypothetical protein [Alphaproteobacteria bacterium]